MSKLLFAVVILGLALAAKPAQKSQVKSDADPDASAPAPAAPAAGPNAWGAWPNPNNPWSNAGPWGMPAPPSPYGPQPTPYSGQPAPFYSPNSQYNPYNPVYNPYSTASQPLTNPMHPSWGHPAYNPGHPLNNPWHPTNAFPAYPSYMMPQQQQQNPQQLQAQAQQQIQDSFIGTKSSSKGPEADVNAPFAEAQNNWANYFAGPTSQYTYPGAPEAAPGVHPTLGGRLNPFNPLGAPSHPYPFPMHQGVKNGARHPRPFTATGQYYPGQSEIPPNFFPNPFGQFGFNPLAFPATAGFQAPYFPAAKNGKMQ